MLKQIVKKALPLLLGLTILLGPFLFGNKTVNAANPSTISFQGKVVNSNGTNVTDGAYSFIFRLYDNGSPTITSSCDTDVHCLWQETQASVQVTNGIFQVELGSSCALTNGSCNNTAGGPINFANNNSLYLTLQFNGDTSGTHNGYMWPVIHLNSVPYALQADNASKLGGLASGNFVQLAQGLQTDTSNLNASIAINKTGTASILTLQKSSANVLLLDNNGLLTLQPAASLTSGQTAFTQTLTNASSTGGTVNGYIQTITVNNTTSASTTNGINISLTDNTALANTNNGIKISLAGTNTGQIQYGIDSSVNSGTALRGSASGIGASTSCGNQTIGFGLGVCGSSTDTTNHGTGVFGVTNASSIAVTAQGAGVAGVNSASGTAAARYVGATGYSLQSNGAAFTSIGVQGIAKAGTGATTYGGYFTLDNGGSATAGAALYASNSTLAANILDLQDNTTSVFTVGDNGLISMQPAANLTAGQTEVAQTLTNGSSTGGTVNGYSQTITVSNTTSASTTNGINISLTDNAAALANNNTGLKISLSGSNTGQAQLGEDISVNRGWGIKVSASGTVGQTLTCGSQSTNVGIGICGSSTATSGTGIIGTTSGSGASVSNTSTDYLLGLGVSGYNNSSSTSADNRIGIGGYSNSTGASGAYTSIGTFGIARATSASAKTYGGYFSLDASSSATSGAALYATNSTVAANILDLQDNTTSVFTVGDNGLISLQPAAALTGTGTQSNISQTLTNNQTAGTVNGYNQTITVSNASGTTTTNGFNISIADNASALANNNNGVNISLTGTNGSQTQIGVNASVNHGAGVVGTSSGFGTNISCGNVSGASIGICGGSSYSSGTGVYGYTSGASSLDQSASSGIYGINNTSGIAANTYVGLKGIARQSAAAAYTSVGVFGSTKAGAGATTYGGYFALDSTSTASAGAALYATNSTVAANILQLQNNNVNAMVVNSSGNVVLGQSSAGGANGTIVFDNSTNSNTITLVTGVTAASGGSGYTLTLPTTGASSSGKCLQSDTGSTVSSTSLTFGSCATGGGGTFASDYSTTSQASNTVTYSNSGGGALVLQDAATPLSTLFTIENNAATFNYLTVTLASSVPHLRVYGASSSNYADIYYDSSTSTAIFAASSGTTQIGTGTGNITFNMTASANAETHNHTGSPAAGYTATDYTFTRNLTGTTFALQGSVLSILDTSSFTSGSSSPNLLYINQNNTSATGNLILAQTGGSTTKFSVDTAGNLTVVGTAGITGNTTITGSLQVQSASGITVGTSSNAGILALFNGTNKVQIQGAASTTAYNFVLPASSGSTNQCLVNTSTPGTLQWLPCGASSTATVTLSPEYAGAVMTHNNNSANGSTGTMTSDFCSGSSHLGIPASSNPCGATQDFNYYSWTEASGANDYDVWTNWQAPTDFSSISSITFYGWTTSSTNDAVKLTVYNAGTACGNSTIAANSTSFTSTTVSTSSCTGGSAIAAGTNVTFDVDLKVGAASDFARVSNIVIVYNRQ